jgi:hypothetical protein
LNTPNNTSGYWQDEEPQNTPTVCLDGVHEFSCKVCGMSLSETREDATPRTAIEEEMGQPYCEKHSPRGITCDCDVPKLDDMPITNNTSKLASESDKKEPVGRPDDTRTPLRDLRDEWQKYVDDMTVAYQILTTEHSRELCNLQIQMTQRHLDQFNAALRAATPQPPTYCPWCEQELPIAGLRETTP